MQTPIVYFWFFALFLAAQNSWAQTGALQGRVYDEVTQEPLIGAVVTLEGQPLGAETNENGEYLIKDIPQGTYAVRAAYTGYSGLTKNQVLIERGVTQLNFALQEKVDTTNTVEIVGSSFQKSAENLTSVKTVGVEQIRSNPGGNFDISRVVQSLPGVSGSVGYRNDIIVRGGAPNENVFYLDGVEVPNINHFATQGSGGGPVGIINSTFIEKVTFQSSSFGAKYDNALSSVLDFDMASGNTQRFQTTLTLGASEAGVTFDTPIGKKVTVLASARASYLQFLFKFIGLPFLPTYYDFQTKVQYKINPKTTLSFIGLGAIDRFRLNKPEDVSPERLYLIDGLPIFRQETYTTGAVLKRLTKKGFFTVALSRNWLNNQSYKDDSLQRRTLDYGSTEAENKLRVNFVNKLGQFQVNYGGVVQFAQYNNRTFSVLPGADSIFYEGKPALIGTALRVDNSLGFFRYGAYGSVSRAFFNNRLNATFGLRFDLNSFTDKGNNPLETLSPRLSVSYKITEKWALNAGGGLYSKLPSYTILGFQNAEGQNNRNARYIRSVHAVLGVEYQPTSSWIVSVEGFYKHYDRYPVSVRDSISLANKGGGYGVFGNEKIESVGQGRAYGFELYTQKMLTKRLYGIASYTLYFSEFAGYNGKMVRSAWDNRHLVSLSGGILLGKKKNWEIAAKWRFLGGAPYTPYDMEKSVQYYLVRGEGVLDYNRLNEEETRFFSQVDVRFDRKWFFKKWSLNIFLDIQNITYTSNPTPPNFTLQRNEDLSIKQPPTGVLLSLDGASVIPSIGARVKF